MRYLATPAVTARISTEAGVLIADYELANSPLHMTVVSRGDNEKAKALLAVALKQRPAYQRVEWWQKDRGALMDSGVSYPVLSEPAAFVCTESRCSLPSFTEERFQQLIRALTGPTAN